MAFHSWGQQYQLLCAYLENTKMPILFLLLRFKEISPVFLSKSSSEDKWRVWCLFEDVWQLCIILGNRADVATVPLGIDWFLWITQLCRPSSQQIYLYTQDPRSGRWFGFFFSCKRLSNLSVLHTVLNQLYSCSCCMGNWADPELSSGHGVLVALVFPWGMCRMLFKLLKEASML